MNEEDRPARRVFHVYHRTGNERTQTDEVAFRVAETGELWGRAPRYAERPAVQAWAGPLGQRWGFEFTTAVPPDAAGVPGKPEWRGPRPGVWVEVGADGIEYAKIEVRVTRIVTQDGREVVP